MYNPKIVIAIPSHGDRTQWIKRTIQNVADDPRVSEIVIRDDGSGPEVEEKLAELENMHDKVNIVLGNKTGSSFMAKFLLMQLLNADEPGWVILLDSDNVIDKDYLGAIFSKVWNAATVYCPDEAGPFSYKRLSGVTINEQNVVGLLKSEVRNDVVMLLNTGNYFINVATYCKFILPDQKPNIDPEAADGIYVNRILMENGVGFHVVPGLRYEHTVHAGSTYLKKAKESKIISDEQIKIMEAW